MTIMSGNSIDLLIKLDLFIHFTQNAVWIKKQIVIITICKGSFYFCYQQHGSVYWKKGARQVLQTATSTEPLHQQLKVAIMYMYIITVTLSLLCTWLSIIIISYIIMYIIIVNIWNIYFWKETTRYV